MSEFKFNCGDVVTHRAIQASGPCGSAESRLAELRFVVVNRRPASQDEGSVVYGLAFWSDGGVRVVTEATEWELRILESNDPNQDRPGDDLTT